MGYEEYLTTVIKFKLKLFKGDLVHAADSLNMKVHILKHYMKKFDIQVVQPLKKKRKLPVSLKS